VGDGRGQACFINGEIDAGQAIHPGRKEGDGVVVDTGGPGQIGHRFTNGVHGGVDAHQLVIARSHPNAAEHFAFGGDEYGVGLGAATVDGQDGGLRCIH